ncbi:hypothetical protein ACFRSX_29430 [Streptomyces goshikiensis]|uniref:hypothetical protein n=1 Tax=Streptomyces TaxID=1883 RepID=UPI00131B0C96|nr:hypothetical protein [Streptomyces sp. CB02120-2]
MSTPTNGPKHTRRIPARHGYGAPSADLQARADRGLARFLGRRDKEQENTDGGEA